MGSFFNSLKNIMVGKPLNFLNPNTKKHMALIAVIAWIGLGADGLSSSAYGPEQAFLALGEYKHVAIYLAIATAVTVFLISLAYNQVIELFPNGGGGYKVATFLIGKKAGVISGSALIVDYILTIAVSVSSGVDAIFSMLPSAFLHYKLYMDILVIIILIILNLRGMKESIKILLPLFIGFLVTHVVIISLGLFAHETTLFTVFPQAIHEAKHMTGSIGLFAMLAILLRAYSLGGGTYTGLEAVSNNVGTLAEPRVRTGKITMLYMAISLSFTAGGIILLYLIWNASPVEGKTLNAVVFERILSATHLSGWWLPIILFFEAALLFVGANTGFLGCPTVMSNMAVDKWLPRQFKEVSNRLVTQNGVLISGIASIFLLLWSRGEVSLLVVLYSINVFLTFTLSLLGLCIYWVKKRHKRSDWWRKLFLSGIGLIVCAGILVITTIEKFSEGGWLTVVVTTIVVLFCFAVRKNYKDTGAKLSDADKLFSSHFNNVDYKHANLLHVEDRKAKTAVFFVSKHYGSGIHALLWVRRLFPGVFTNFVFLTAGEIDSETLTTEAMFKVGYRKDLNTVIEKFRYFATENNLPSEGLFSYGVSETEELLKLSETVAQDYSDCIFFASKLVFVDESWWSRLLHNNTVNSLQRELHLRGNQMIILPMKI